MPKQPPVHEREFLTLSVNHAEFTRKLSQLGCPAPDVQEFAQHVCLAWFSLGEEHLRDAKEAAAKGLGRSALSRAYYAAYNVSKATRYLVRGQVSMRGDDHGRASTELPTDFPDAASWCQRITRLYENRLKADYDNWSTTAAEFSLDSETAVNEAEAFVSETRNYLTLKYGIQL